MTQSKTMKAVAIDRFGGIETLETQELPIPAVGADEVLVLTSGWPNFAFSAAILMVQAIAVSQPPPRAKPLIAAITGFPRFSIRFRTACPKLLDLSASTGVM